MFNLLPSAIMTPHVAQNDGTGPSLRILQEAHGQITSPDGHNRLLQGIADDFVGHIKVVPGNDGTASGTLERYSYYIDTTTAAGSMVSDETVYGGVLKMLTSAQDNYEVSLKAGVAGQLNSKKLCFEVGADLPVGAGTVFLGLTSPGVVATNVLTDADALSDANFFGFLISAGSIAFVSKATGEAMVTLAAAIGTVTGRHKVGFVYGDRQAGGKLKIYVDGIEKASLTYAEVIAGANADSIPLAIPLAPIASMKNTAATALTLGMDWWYCYHAMA